MDYTPQTVNLHIRASDEEALQRLQYANNLANMRVYNYQTPYESNKGDLVVWFYGDITTWIKVDESIFEDKSSEFNTMDTDTLLKENSKLGADS
mgnify:CR=1 FL=1|tara:strand:- start:1670 stop:1951 length:282 start_codon:yes stop_codon:yes gene_type:complete